MIREIVSKYRFDKNSDRIGPDCPFTHWKLYFKSSMVALCQKKFTYFGKNAEFRPGAYAICCSKISIGDNVIIRPNSMLFADPRPNGKGITIEDDVMLGSGVHMYVHNHRFDNPNISIIHQGYYDSKEIIIKRGAWIGANSVILPGVIIGENCVVGAGSIVTHSLPDRTVAVGTPAKVVRKISLDNE
jgi:acetyltransferase-like isoleucine patch superfamily enzyme